MKSTTSLSDASQAIQDEIVRLNQAISEGKIVTIETAFGVYTVMNVTSSMDARCHNGNTYFTRTFALCNDSQWEGLLAQADIERNSFFLRRQPHMTYERQWNRAINMTSRFKAQGVDALWAYGKGGGFWLKDHQPAYIPMSQAIKFLDILESQSEFVNWWVI